MHILCLLFGNLKIIDGVLTQVVRYIAAVFLGVHCPLQSRTYILKNDGKCCDDNDAKNIVAHCNLNILICVEPKQPHYL